MNPLKHFEIGVGALKEAAELDRTPIKKIVADIDKIQSLIHHRIFAPVMNSGEKALAADLSKIITTFTDIKEKLREMEKKK